MKVKVLFFGMVTDIVGLREDCPELAGPATAGAVFEHYARRFPKLGELRASIVLARNRRFAARDEAVEAGDEIALLPPVSGGSGRFTHEISGDPEGSFFALAREPLDAAALGRRIVRGEDGALVSFEGVVRNNANGRAVVSLDYECYEPMALEVMAQIGAGLAREFPVGRIAMAHRLGSLRVGEASVVVVVSAPHREAAFRAAQEGIGRLKRTVPIWKKEFFADGEAWVDGEWDESLRAR